MTQIEQIKAEIERLRNECAKSIGDGFVNGDLPKTMTSGGAAWVCEQLLSFIESMEKEQFAGETMMEKDKIDTAFTRMMEKEQERAPKIKGWVARNPNGEVFFSVKEPHQVQAPGKGQRPHYTIWDDEEHFQMYLPKIAKQLPDDPIEVELTISRVVK